VRFLLQVCLGLVRDQTQRRHALSIFVVIALVMLFVGSTFLAPWLMAHVVWFFIFWFACMWLTILIFLLAAYDLLVVRKAGREAQRRLRKQIFSKPEDE
jgi:MFS family permease